MKTPIKTTLLALAAGLIAASAPLASAQAAQNRPAPQQSQPNQSPQHQNQNQNQHQGQQPQQSQNDRYGRWDNAWGARPAAPPRNFTRTSDWHRHVRACQQRYRSYDARTDRYTVRRGQTAICRL